jgi:RHS repeat-associated protein
LALLLGAGTAFYYQADGLGSITSLTTTGGTLAETYSYDSFGQTSTSGGVVNPFQYTGREFDSETGLYYYRARYYDPVVGRFVNEDPLGIRLSDPNVYLYAGANPVHNLDPFGTDWLDNVFNFIAGAGDSLTFGGTALVRRMMNDGYDPADHCTRSYKGGEYTEIAVEIGLTLGSAAMKQAAKNASKELVRKEAARLSEDIVRGGKELHHRAPLFGHPGNLGPTLFPTGGLPGWMHTNKLTTELLSPAEHYVEHVAIRALESIASKAINPYTTTGRLIRNVLTGGGCGCH